MLSYVPPLPPLWFPSLVLTSLSGTDTISWCLKLLESCRRGAGGPPLLARGSDWISCSSCHLEGTHETELSQMSTGEEGNLSLLPAARCSQLGTVLVTTQPQINTRLLGSQAEDPKLWALQLCFMDLTHFCSDWVCGLISATHQFT